MSQMIDLTKTTAYDYLLPKELIAQDPAEPRDSSRLLLVDRGTSRLEDHVFRDIISCLQPQDLLVLNDTKVLPARLEGVKKYGGAKVEIFFLRPDGDEKNRWISMVKPGRKLPEGTVVTLNDQFEVTVGARLEDGLRTIEFHAGDDPLAVIHLLGTTPLPHYITETNAAPERYQTVYANEEKENSVAAPTAGLHFTEELLKKLTNKGVRKTFVTLQVGLGTFRPVKTDNIYEHIMHCELCEVSKEASQMISETKRNGGRVIAVGTTVVRTLESFAKEYGEIKPGILNTRLFISPGYEFKAVDAMITNFHLPKSTLLMLVSAFGGYETMMKAYQHAVQERYRFFSFGDSMFIQ